MILGVHPWKSRSPPEQWCFFIFENLFQKGFRRFPKPKVFNEKSLAGKPYCQKFLIEPKNEFFIR
jgi:hypothetical protein